MTPPLGIIEGFFGPLWTWEERVSVARLLAPAGYDFWHYAPKGDALLRKAWQQPFSPDQLKALVDGAASIRATGMRFGVGLTPFGAQHGFGSDERAAMKAKLAQLDAAGIDDLAILFDDMDGAIADLAERQAKIVAFVADHSRAGALLMCPSYYSDDGVLDRVFGHRPERYLETLGQRLDPAVAVYWTGEEVCARSISAGHIADVTQRLGRKPALWDNWPVNDGPRMSSHLHLRAFTGRDAAVGAMISHHAINPALQPRLSCIAALTLPRVYAEGSDFRYMTAFAEAATTVCGAQLAQMLAADLLTFEDGGLERMSDERKAKLTARYAAVDHPAAREVVRWLAGGYAVSAEQVQTQ